MSREGDIEDYSMEPSVSDVEMWLEWQAQQLGTPAWWMELKAIPGIRNPWKLTQNIRASFYIPKVRMRALLELEYTALPTPRSLNRNTLLPDELSYQDVWATTSSPNNCLCQEPAILGRKTKSAKKPGSPSFSGKCC